ncbi:hypothetical protein KUCAC02_035405, partial [Chaenocephalus aceratus]
LISHFSVKQKRYVIFSDAGSGSCRGGFPLKLTEDAVRENPPPPFINQSRSWLNSSTVSLSRGRTPLRFAKCGGASCARVGPTAADTSLTLIDPECFSPVRSSCREAVVGND